MPKLVRLGNLDIGTVPRVVGVLSAPLTLDRVAGGFRPACDALEFRLDQLGTGSELWFAAALQVEREGMPVLITIRHAREGGHWYGSEEARLTLYERVVPHVSAIDFEIRSAGCADLARRAHAAGKTVIGSFHDFHALPSRSLLEAVVEEGFAAGVDIVKLAVRTETESDVVELGRLLAGHHGHPLCLLGMGAWGPASRLRLPSLGSCLTYGFVDESNAPGQISSADLMAHFKRL